RTRRSRRRAGSQIAPTRAWTSSLAHGDRRWLLGAGRFPRGRLDRQAPNLDEADGCRVIEPIAGIVGCQRVIVQRVRRFPADDAGAAFEEFETDDARHALLHLLDK